MLFSFGGNLLYSQPDTKLAKKALQKLKFHVHADMFLNPTANLANIVLPVASAWEREGLCTGFDCSLIGMRHVQLRQPVIPAVGDSQSDTSIVMKLSKLLGFSDKFFNCDVDSGYNEILKKTELTASNLRLTPAGIKLAKGGIYKAFEKKNNEGHPVGFLTPTRKIEIYSELFKLNGYAPVPALNSIKDYTVNKCLPLILSGAKTLAFCHSQHRNINSLRKLMPDPTLQISHKTAAPRNIKDGDWVKIITKKGFFIARVQLLKGLAPDSVFAQHGWWVGDFDSKQHRFTTNLNSVIDTSIADPISGSVPMRCSRCEIVKLF
jgi:anaerobic selenocysteine-containing dehydrogenase